MEKEHKKINLKHAILLIILFSIIAMIITYFFCNGVDNKKQNGEIVRSENNVKKIENESENEIVLNENVTNKVEGNNTASAAIEWEDYPNDDKWLDEELKSSVEMDSTEYKLMRKTLYSLSKNKINSFQKKYYEIYAIGDSTEIFDWTSNYDRYCYPNNENNDLTAKYTKKITYDIANFNEIFYEGHYDLNVLVKNQYNTLVVKKDYGYYDNVPKSFYFEIPNMLIMNGNNESKEEYKNNSRAKKIKVTMNKEKEYIFELKDTNKVQVFDIGYKQENIEKPVNIEIEVIDTYKGEKTNDVYISDIQFGITSNIPQGR